MFKPAAAGKTASTDTERKPQQREKAKKIAIYYKGINKTLKKYLSVPFDLKWKTNKKEIFPPAAAETIPLAFHVK